MLNLSNNAPINRGKELPVRCNICDSSLNEPVFNKEIDGWEPCHTCMEVINDTVAGYRDRTVVSEDEFEDEYPCIDLDHDIIEYEI